jgi:hypothetical protein
MIAPRVGATERTYAEEQAEYMPITVAVVPIENGPYRGACYLLARYTLTAEERRRVAEGEDLYVAQLNFGDPMTPLRVGLRDAFGIVSENDP